jgi:hypothetical protein
LELSAVSYQRSVGARAVIQARDARFGFERVESALYLVAPFPNGRYELERGSDREIANAA